MDNNSIEYILNPSVSNPVRFEPRIRVAVLASGVGSNFQAIIESIQRHDLYADVVCLISNNPESKVLEKAKKYQIPYVVHENDKYQSRSEFDRRILQTLEFYRPEIIVMAGWMRIATSILIDSYPNKIINIHPSLLPAHKGVNALKQTLDYGSKIAGCTVHIVNEEVDAGEILVQAAMPIIEAETITELQTKIHKLEHKILVLGINLLGQRIRMNNHI